MAANSGVQACLISGNRGRLSATQVEQAINPPDLHRPVTRLVCLENTVNRGGGCCYDFNDILAIREVCNKYNLKLHLDGARLFNALVAKSETPQRYGSVFDSISVCLSKGLGCPVGSVLLGNNDFISRSRRIRKRMGGGMRQAGILAAAGIYALDHHIPRLAEDHFHAVQIAEALRQKDFIGQIFPVETNILIFEVKGKFTAASLSQKLKEYDIFTIAVSNSQIRMVLHFDITPEMVKKTCNVLKSL
jgi:threonine aldolase